MLALLTEPEVALSIIPAVLLMSGVVILLKATQAKRYASGSHARMMEADVIGDWAYKVWFYPQHPGEWSNEYPFGYEILHHGETVDVRERAYTTQYHARNAALGAIAALSQGG